MHNNNNLLIKQRVRRRKDAPYSRDDTSSRQFGGGHFRVTVARANVKRATKSKIIKRVGRAALVCTGTRSLKKKKTNTANPEYLHNSLRPCIDGT